MTTICHGCQDVTRRQVEALEAQLAEARAALARVEAIRECISGQADRLRWYAWNCEARMTEDPPRLSALRDQHMAVVDRLEAFARDLLAALTPTTGTEQPS